MSGWPVCTRRWTRKEYARLAEVGVLRADEPIELVGGHLVVAEPKGSPHTTAVEVAAEALRVAFGSGWAVRVQAPLAIGPDSEPEPDVAVVPGGHRDYRDAHPARPALVVEVSDSSLAFDRRSKGSLYARAGIADYWIVNLVDEVLEIHRRPAPDRPAEFGWRYADVEIVRAGATVSPLAKPDATVRVTDLLP